MIKDFVENSPLNQVGRIHGVGSSSGIKGIQVLKYPNSKLDMQVKYPITSIAQGTKI